MIMIYMTCICVLQLCDHGAVATTGYIEIPLRELLKASAAGPSPPAVCGGWRRHQNSYICARARAPARCAFPAPWIFRTANANGPDWESRPRRPSYLSFPLGITVCAGAIRASPRPVICGRWIRKRLTIRSGWPGCSDGCCGYFLE